MCFAIHTATLNCFSDVFLLRHFFECTEHAFVVKYTRHVFMSCACHALEAAKDARWMQRIHLVHVYIENMEKAVQQNAETCWTWKTVKGHSLMFLWFKTQDPTQERKKTKTTQGPEMCFLKIKHLMTSALHFCME